MTIKRLLILTKLSSVTQLQAVSPLNMLFLTGKSMFLDVLISVNDSSIRCCIKYLLQYLLRSRTAL